MPEAGRKKILIADDEQDAREYVKAILEDDFQIVEAQDGGQAFDLAKSHNVDLIILDIQMPGQSGFDAFPRIRQDPDLRDVPVIMLTGVREKTGVGFSREEMEDHFGQAPAAYLEKPIDAEILRSTVMDCLGGCGCC